ncbi:MFS transporter [Halobacillus amylolyticus]|uniref:MFS transporter n=1 Tax=Halobacillus amylolyticus TaxID=2932259 RepID=A0ABY4HCE1_9BACI|nr:MFS transporter [Halobacillus amylolyticus]UOR12566.1 MFS transporter [Halobacillus amylolyticus]
MDNSSRIRLTVGWITLFLMGTDLFVVSPLLPFISQEYHITSAEAGWMVTVFAITYAVSAPFFGWISDKKGRRYFIILGLFLFVLANILTGLAPSFSWLIGSRILAGLSVASITPLIYAIIGDVAPSDRRGAWLSIVVSGHLMALWAGAPVGALLEHLLGWRFVFLAMALMGAILVVINFKTWESIPRIPSGRKVIKGNMARILGSVSVTTIWAISMYALYVYLGAALYSLNKFTTSEVSLAVTFFGIGAVMGSLTSGQMTDRFGESVISKVTLALLSIVLIVLGVFFSSGGWIYLILFLWALVGYAGFTSYQARLAADFQEHRGTAFAWNNTALYIGITLGSIIGSYVVANWGYSLLPFISSGAAAISFVMSTHKLSISSRLEEVK